MTIELWVLIWSAILLYGLISLNSGANLYFMGISWGAGNRDTTPAQSPEWVIRTKRAYTNLIENLVLYIAIAGTAHMAGVHTEMTTTGAQIFFIGRLIHAFAYVSGTTVLWLRTVGYFTGIAGMLLILIELL